MNDVIAYEEKENLPFMAPFELQAFERGKEKGVEEGIEEGLRQATVSTLIVRFGALSEDLQAQITAVTNPAELQELHRQALLADSLEAFMAYLDE